MKCTLESIYAKAIAKAIQSLSKIGADLFIEADENGLQFRTFTASKSAMATIRFSRMFFETYDVKDSDVNYCKVCMKTILAAFKNMRNVECCEMRLLGKQLKLQIKFKCSLETMKNTLIAIVEDEMLTINVSMDEAKNTVIGSYKIFNDISNNFNPNESEITLEAMGNGLTVKNYMDGARVNDKFMRSQYKLSPCEFDTYTIVEESCITFSLREFRAFLAFAETINEKLIVNFSHEGSPLFVTIKKLHLIECDLVMATVLPNDVSFYDKCLVSEINEPSNTYTRSKTKITKRKHSNPDVNNTTAKKRLSEETTLSNETTLFNFDAETNNTSLSSVQAVRNGNQRQVQHAIDEDDDIILAAAGLETPDLTFPSSSNNYDDAKETKQSPQTDYVPKIRTIFARCFETTYIPKEPSPNSEAFVPNSDTEE